MKLSKNYIKILIKEAIEQEISDISAFRMMQNLYGQNVWPSLNPDSSSTEVDTDLEKDRIKVSMRELMAEAQALEIA